MFRPQILHMTNAEACRRVNSQDSAVPLKLDRFQNCTLGGITEFFAASQMGGPSSARSWRGDSDDSKVGRLYSLLQRVWEGSYQVPLSASREVKQIEFFQLNTYDSVVPNRPRNLELHQYEARLVASGIVAGLPKSLSYGLASVAHELVENVFQHSDGDDRKCFRGIMGYHSCQNYFSLSVCDLGIGALRSLKLSSEWQHLQSDREALEAIIDKGASRKSGLGPGEGLKNVFQNLVDRRTSIRIRSGNEAVIITASKEGREVQWHPSSPLEGIHVNIFWNPTGALEEKEVFLQLTQ